MSENIHKSHNVSRLMYHFVFPTKYRRVVVGDEVEKVIKETCIEISKRYDLYFLEVNTIPGMTSASLVPKMVRTAGIDMTDFLTSIIESR